MKTELSAIMAQPGRVVDWASKITYNANLDGEDKEISEVMDAWAKEVGRTGYDEHHEISQLINKSITPDSVTAPSALIDAIFDQSSIGEFDDSRATQTPKNTIKVFDAAKGGTVDRSFIEHKVFKPTWVNLQAETDVRLSDMRKGGYKTVANLVNYISEAMELKKYAKIMDILDAAIVSGSANYFSETTAAPSEANMDAFILYLLDMADGETPQVFGLNKYIQKVAGYDKAYHFATDAIKNQFNQNGLIDMYAGAKLTGFSGQRKLGDGSLVLSNQRIYGAAGKLGEVVTRGETTTLQETDINNEKIHVKVGGYTFGTMVTNPERAAKMVMAK